MSDNRNTDGTFAPTVPLVGRDSVEEAQGYVKMADPLKDDDEPASTVESEAQRLTQFREPGFKQDDVELAYLQPDGSRADARETISLTRAAEDAAKYHEAQEQDLTEIKRSVIASEVDADRAIAIDGDPRKAAQFGFEVAAEPEVKAQPPEDRNTKLQRMVEDPDVQEFLETNATRAAEAANHAEVWGRSSLLAIAPELGQLALDQWPGAIQIIASSDPQRGQILATMFQNVERATLAQQQYREQQSAVREHQFPNTKRRKTLVLSRKPARPPPRYQR